LRAEIDRVARSDAKVLITGESGTGKEVVARAINAASPRAHQPFVPVNCAGIPETLLESELFGHVKGSFTGAYRDKPGKLEMSDHGTIFLDEIGEMTLRMQGLLLRFLETGEIQKVGAERAANVTNVRVITATNRNLRDLIGQGQFREDLYYRINVIPLRMPPLRERTEDIPELVRFFVARYSARFRKTPVRVSDEALGVLQRYRWPGNIRELENLVERLVAMNESGSIEDEDLPVDVHLPHVGSPGGDESLLQQAMNAFERTYILRALERADWNVSQAARELGIPLSTLKHKMGRLDIREIARRYRSF
jgi:transcriptional regulator with PAS, ATPase and Fis domain